MEAQRYCAFISYRHQSPDMQVAKALHSAIETYRVPAGIRAKTGKKRMGRVFRDEEELPLSADLGADIEAALDGSEWFIAICSPRYLESRWCMRELEYFIERKGRSHVLAILVEGEPDKSFPELIRFETDAAGQRTEVEPLAADIRGANWRSKLKNEKLRLLAPMLSVTYDDLRRRERRRRIRNAVAVSAAALAALTGLGIFLAVNHARSEALKQEAAAQQRIAEEQAKLAEEQRRIAAEEQLRADQEKLRAQQEQQRAEQEQQRAEQEQQRAEQERRTAVLNDIGERLERAEKALLSRERREAARILLDALALSDGEEGARHEEVVALLRRSMYIEPFSIVSGFNRQNMRILDISPSPDGRRAMGVVNNNSIVMIDLFTNEILYQVSAENAQLIDPVFSPDGSRFMANCDNGRLVKVWNTQDGSEALTYVSDGNASYEIGAQFFWKDSDTLLIQDGSRLYLVSVNGDKTLFYTFGQQMDGYDPANNLLTRLSGRTLDQLFSNVSEGYAGIQVLLSEDRSRVVLSGKAGEFAVIVLDGEGRRLFLPALPNDPACKVAGTFAEKWAISPDGKTLCCLSMYGFIAGWDVDSGAMILIDALEGNLGSISSGLVFSPDSARMAYTFGPTLYVTEARTNTPLVTATIDETMYTPSLAFTSDGRYLLMTNESMFIINAQTWALELMEQGEAGRNYNNVIPLKDMFLITKIDGSAYLYSMPDLASVRIETDFSRPLCPPYLSQEAVACVPLLGQHQLSEGFKVSNYYANYPNRLFFSRDKKTAALAYPDGVIELFDTEGDGAVREMVGQLYAYIQALAMTEERLIASSADGQLLIYNYVTHTVDAILNDGTLYESFAFDESGTRMMALCAGLSRIDVFSLEDDALLFSLSAGTDTFTDFAFSADGAYAVGRTSAGTWVVGDLWQDETALVAQARRFTNSQE